MIKDRVSIELTEKKQEKIGSIHLPDRAQEKDVTKDGKIVFEGVVHGIGPDVDKDLEPGDRVLFDAAYASTYGPFFVVKNENILLILGEDEIERIEDDEQ